MVQSTLEAWGFCWKDSGRSQGRRATLLLTLLSKGLGLGGKPGRPKKRGLRFRV